MKLLMTTCFSPMRSMAIAAVFLAAGSVAQAADPVPLTQGGKFVITTNDIEADALMRMPAEMRPMVLSNKQSVGQVAMNMYVRHALGQSRHCKRAG